MRFWLLVMQRWMLIAGAALMIEWAGQSVLFAQDPSAEDSDGQLTKTDQVEPVISTAEELTVRLAKECESGKLPAMWAGSFPSDGRPSMLAAAGVRRWGGQERAEVHDIVHLGSCTKAMTAVIIGQLCTEGKLALDQSLGELMPESQTIQGSNWKQITVRELLQHRSGAPGNSMNYAAFDLKHPNSIVDARQAFMESLAKRSLHRRQRFIYSNEGYIILGHVAEVLCGQPWEELMRERIFKRLDMPSAGFGPVGAPDGTPSGETVAGRPWGHTPTVKLSSIFSSLVQGEAPADFEPVQIDNSPCLGPAGRAHMNLPDWSKFVTAFASDKGYERLSISPQVWQDLLTPAAGLIGDESYAGGWVILNQPRYEGVAYFHNGSNTSWYCYALAAPGKQKCVLVVSNCFTDLARKACHEVAQDLMR